MKPFKALLALVCTLALFGAAGHGADRDSAYKGQGDVIDLLRTDGHYRTLLSMLDETGLTPDFRGRDTFTIFAPTDDAFQKFGNLDALRRDREGLRNILNNHVASNAIITVDGLKQLPILKMRSGSTWTIRDNGTTIGDARIIHPDMLADNGVVHGIDTILMKNLRSDEPIARTEPAVRVETFTRVEPGTRIEYAPRIEPGSRVEYITRTEPGVPTEHITRIEYADGTRVEYRDRTVGDRAYDGFKSGASKIKHFFTGN